MAIIFPEWKVAPNVRCAISTRDSSQVSTLHAPEYANNNLGSHVGDNNDAVTASRQHLTETLHLKSKPVWLNQVHGTDVQILSSDSQSTLASADAAYTNEVNQVCTIMTADCLPILLASTDGKEVAAVHAGWRGLLDGVIEATIKQFASKDIQVYLGPAISQKNFTVGKEVYDLFLAHSCDAKKAFIPSENEAEKYLLDIYLLAKQRLQVIGITDISGGGYCTYDEERFYSYRKACHQGDGRTGRIASLIWIES